MIAKQLAAYIAWCKANKKKPQEYNNLKAYSKQATLEAIYKGVKA